MKSSNSLINLYHQLLKKHSYQGWWPIKGKYFPANYTYPHNSEEEFETSRFVFAQSPHFNS